MRGATQLAKTHSLLARQSLVVGTSASAKVDLSGDDEIGATPVKLLNDATPIVDYIQ